MAGVTTAPARARSPLTSKLEGFGTTIFGEMTALAIATGAINLGQGFPDTDGPAEVLDAAVAAIRSGVNQYPPPLGDPVLRHAVADHQRRFYGLELDPDTEVLVTAGATEALAGSLLGMLDAGDEVVVFEPMYDSYQACIALAGARAVPVLLQPGDDGRYHYDPAELRAAVSPRTKLILLNTPHNPTGKVFGAAELAEIAGLAIEHDLIVVSDEVYEHLVFPGASHVPIATLPGMAERTLTISSGGKTFNTTGWKIGWLCGPPALVTAAKTAKQFLTYVSGAPFQPAIAAGLRLDDDYFAGIATDLAAKRDRLVGGSARGRLHDVRARGDVLHDGRHPPGPARRRRDGVLPLAAGAVRRGRHPERGVLRPHRARPAPRPLRLLQALRGARRSGVPIGDAGVTSQLRIAAVQHDIVWNDRDANFERLAPMVRSAAGAGAGLVLLTETFSTGFVTDDIDVGEPEGGPSSTFLVDQAREHGVWVGGSCPEIPHEASPDDQRPANSFVLAGPDGSVHRYRKIHPFSFGGEEKYFRPGTDFVTVDVEGLRVSLFVCYDLRFADEFWQLAHDTDVFLVPANWPAKRRLAWTTLLQARAIENQAYVVGVNRVGDGNGIPYTGDSRIVDPLGELLATASHTESILLADISAAHGPQHPRPLPLPPRPPLTHPSRLPALEYFVRGGPARSTRMHETLGWVEPGAPVGSTGCRGKH